MTRQPLVVPSADGVVDTSPYAASTLIAARSDDVSSPHAPAAPAGCMDKRRLGAAAAADAGWPTIVTSSKPADISARRGRMLIDPRSLIAQPALVMNVP